MRLGFFLVSVLTAFLAHALMHRWSPRLSHDTVQYVLPALQSERGMGALAPFAFHAQNSAYEAGVIRPASPEAKPLAMVWARSWWGFRGASLSAEAAVVESVSVALGLVALLTILLATTALPPGASVLAGVFSVLNPWMLTSCYFSPYLAPSLAVAFLSLVLLAQGGWGRTLSPRWLFAIGALFSVMLLMNQSLLVFGAAFGLWMLKRNRSGIVFLALGFGAAWIGWEGLAALAGSERTMVGVILDYLQRSRHERTETHSVYVIRTFLPALFTGVSWVLGLSVVLAGIMALSRAFWSPAKGKFRGLAGELLGLSALTWLLIEIQMGPKMSRTYLVLFPLLTVVGFSAVREVFRSRSLSRAAIGVFCAALAWEVGGNLRQMRTFLLGVPDWVKMASTSDVRVLEGDIHAPLLRDAIQWATPEVKVSLLCEGPIAPGTQVLVGPLAETVFDTRPSQGQAKFVLETVGTDVTVACGNRSLRLARGPLVPFAAFYPYLVLEDQGMTYWIYKHKRPEAGAYKTGAGWVQTWEVRAAASSKPTGS